MRVDRDAAKIMRIETEVEPAAVGNQLETFNRFMSNFGPDPVPRKDNDPRQFGFRPDRYSRDIHAAFVLAADMLAARRTASAFPTASI